MDQFVSCLKGKFDLLNYCGRSQVVLIIKNLHYELQRVFGMPKKQFLFLESMEMKNSLFLLFHLL